MERALMCAVQGTSLTTFSIFKSQYHYTVKFRQVERFVDKGERTVRKRLFLRLRERTPGDEDYGRWVMKRTHVLEKQDRVREIDTPCRRMPSGPRHMETENQN